MDLPSNVSKQIDLLSEMGNDLAGQGEFTQAAERWSQALELLPAPQAAVVDQSQVTRSQRSVATIPRVDHVQNHPHVCRPVFRF